ncbi:MAG: acyltransferase [Bacteroidales bacterium]|nr:acyltransferase [Bacteroidales bacterium]
METRISYFDNMKGVAILLVVIGHIMLFSFGFEDSQLVIFLCFHMPVFFYISGFFAYKEVTSLRSLCERLIKRGLTLLIPYVVFLCAWYIFAGRGSEILEIAMGGGGRYWFLYTLFVLSAFFLVYEYVIRRVKRAWVYVSLWIVPYIVLIAIKFHLTHDDGNAYEIVTGLVNYYRYFLIGYLCRKYVNLNKLLFGNDVAACVGFVAFLLNWYFFDYHNILLVFGGNLGAIVVLQRFFQTEMIATSKVGAALSSIGRHSLAIYVIHYFFIPDISASVHDFLDCGNPFIWQLTFAFLVSIPIVAASMFVGKLIETNRILNFVCFGKMFWREKK